MKLEFLHHFLNESTPGYGGNKGFQATPLKCMQDGDSCNQAEWKINNHHGTHIDLPHHFFQDGATLEQYSPDQFLFTNPTLISLPFSQNELISPNHLKDQSIDVQSDMILFKTGFESFRASETYWQENPGFLPEVAAFLLKKAPGLRAIGFDFISLTAYQHRPVGKLAHQAFLNPEAPILIIEDMKLSDVQSPPDQVIVAPLPVESADGGPCSVIAIYNK